MDIRKGGSAEFTDLSAYTKWFGSLSVDEAQTILRELTTYIDQTTNSFRYDPVKEHITKTFNCEVFGISAAEERKRKWPAQRQAHVEELNDFYDMQRIYGQTIHVREWVEGLYAFLYFGDPDQGVVIYHPEQYLRYIPPKDWSHCSPAEARALLNAPRSDDSVLSLVSADTERHMTTAGLQEMASQTQDRLTGLEKEMEDVKEAKTGELAELKAKADAIMAELRKKQEAMMAQLEKKKAEMEQVKEKMEWQIYLLDSQIYAIRCYSGDVVQFAKIREGKNAPDTEPVIIHQKLRFLDEDLGRLTSLYTIDWEDIGLFEEFLKHSPVALDTFAPNDRCITLVRLSKSNTVTKRNHELLQPAAEILLLPRQDRRHYRPKRRESVSGLVGRRPGPYHRRLHRQQDYRAG